MTEPLIRTHNLTRTYGKGESQIRALDGVNLRLDHGEFMAVIGASGSGKSTLMNMLGGLDRPNSGEIYVAGQSIGEMKNKQLAKFRNATIGFVFQQFQLLPKKSALHNVKLPLQYRRPPVSDMDARAKAALERVGLGDRIHHKPTELSGGQQQRVAIARALVTEPDLLLADEPTGALDSKTSADVMALLQELNAQGVSMVLITHDLEIANYASRTITMRDGKIISDERRSAP